MGSKAAIVNSAYEAFAVGDIPTVIGMLTDDVTWLTPATVPQGGEFSGPDGVVKFFEGIGANWSSLRLDIESVGEVGDDTVVGIVRAQGELTGGTPSSYGAVHVFGIRAGKIASFREYTNLDRAIA
jgi:ketosteroid isomerase-like protein